MKNVPVMRGYNGIGKHCMERDSTVWKGKALHGKGKHCIERKIVCLRRGAYTPS